MSNNFAQQFDALRAEAYRIAERADPSIIRKLRHEHRDRERDERIARLEDQIDSYVSMLNALDREIEHRNQWTDTIQTQNVQQPNTSASG